MNKKQTKALLLAGVLVIIAGATYYTSHKAEAPVTVTDATVLPGVQTSEAPWIAEVSQLRNRLNVLGLPALTEEGQALHIHQHLDIFVHGKVVPVPTDIGINHAEGFISPIHVHDTTNIIHVESPVVQTFTLGQFFAIWGVRLTNKCIGGYCTDGTNTMKVFVNGTPYTSDPVNLALAAHQEIVITYGTDAEIPNPVPSSFTFPANY
jgi:hypothetical protein